MISTTARKLGIRSACQALRNLRHPHIIRVLDVAWVKKLTVLEKFQTGQRWALQRVKHTQIGVMSNPNSSFISWGLRWRGNQWFRCHWPIEGSNIAVHPKDVVLGHDAWTISYMNWFELVGGLEHLDYFSIYWECHHPNWLIFLRGVKTTNQWTFDGFFHLLGVHLQIRCLIIGHGPKPMKLPGITTHSPARVPRVPV